MDYPLAAADASFLGEEGGDPNPIPPIPGDELGRRVAGAGDVNGDGYDDFLFGASYNDQVSPDAGKAYLILGRAAADWGLDYPAALADASFLGEWTDPELPGDQAGRRVSGAGDVNHDGFADFLIGAPDNDRGGVDGGVAYMFYGRAAADWGQDLSLAEADVIYTAVSEGDNAGFDIAPAGDMDGDGIDDFLVGAWAADEPGGHWCGHTYVMLSDESPLPMKFLPDAPQGEVGIWRRFTGEYWDPSGWNDIGMAQLVIGTGGGDPNTLKTKYEVAENGLYLWDTAGSAWLGPCAPGDPVTLSSGITELDCQRSVATNDGRDEVRVRWRARWLEPVPEPVEMDVHLRVVDMAGNDSRPVAFGSWTLLP
jgi:hypothetical protein